MTRSREQRDRDRADLLAVLQEEGPLTNTTLIARALGYADEQALFTAYPWAAMQQATRDLHWLARSGKITGSLIDYRASWRLATDDDHADDEDLADVERAMGQWEPA